MTTEIKKQADRAIDRLRESGQHDVANSLVGIKNGLDKCDATAKRLQEIIDRKPTRPLRDWMMGVLVMGCVACGTHAVDVGHWAIGLTIFISWFPISCLNVAIGRMRAR